MECSLIPLFQELNSSLTIYGRKTSPFFLKEMVEKKKLAQKIEEYVTTFFLREGFGLHRDGHTTEIETLCKKFLKKTSYPSKTAQDLLQKALQGSFFAIEYLYTSPHFSTFLLEQQQSLLTTLATFKEKELECTLSKTPTLSLPFLFLLKNTKEEVQKTFLEKFNKLKEAQKTALLIKILAGNKYKLKRALVDENALATFFSVPSFPLDSLPNILQYYLRSKVEFLYRQAENTSLASLHLSNATAFFPFEFVPRIQEYGAEESFSNPLNEYANLIPQLSPIERCSLDFSCYKQGANQAIKETHLEIALSYYDMSSYLQEHLFYSLSFAAITFYQEIESWSQLLPLCEKTLATPLITQEKRLLLTYLIGKALYHKKELEQAKTFFKKALRLSAKAEEKIYSYQYLIEVSIKMKDWEEAHASVTEARKICSFQSISNEKKVLIEVLFGKLLLKEEKWKESESILEAILEKAIALLEKNNPLFYQIYYYLGKTQLYQYKKDEAMGYFDAAFLLAQNKFATYKVSFYQAKLLAHVGETEEAKEMCSQILQEIEPLGDPFIKIRKKVEALL